MLATEDHLAVVGLGSSLDHEVSASERQQGSSEAEVDSVAASEVQPSSMPWWGTGTQESAANDLTLTGRSVSSRSTRQRKVRPLPPALHTNALWQACSWQCA